MKKSFREIDHSGDIGIEAHGRNLKELFSNAALGLLGLMARGGIAERIDRSIRVESESYESLLIDWLSEIIAGAASRGELYSSVSVNELGEYYIDGTLRGEPFDPVKHDLRLEVKAATYHRLYIKERADGYTALVIFDL